VRHGGPSLVSCISEPWYSRAGLQTEPCKQGRKVTQHAYSMFVI
jgi:hypothetical protein